jgi:hypothetical protein
VHYVCAGDCYSQIADAVDASSANDQVMVQGVLLEVQRSVNITKPLTITYASAYSGYVT